MVFFNERPPWKLYTFSLRIKTLDDREVECSYRYYLIVNLDDGYCLDNGQFIQ